MSLGGVVVVGDKTQRAASTGRTSPLSPSGLRDESGAVAIIVALVMVALLSIVALVIDLGGLYDHDRELQTAADAAALAGAQANVTARHNAMGTL